MAPPPIMPPPPIPLTFVTIPPPLPPLTIPPPLEVVKIPPPIPLPLLLEPITVAVPLIVELLSDGLLLPSEEIEFFFGNYC